jgi:hypothetical protein
VDTYCECWVSVACLSQMRILSVYLFVPQKNVSSWCFPHDIIRVEVAPILGFVECSL